MSTSSRLGPRSIYLIMTELAVPPHPTPPQLAGFFFSTATASLQVNIKKRKEKKKKDNKDEVLCSSRTESAATENIPFFSPSPNVYEEPKDFCYPFPIDVLYQCRCPPNSVTSPTIVVGGGCGDSNAKQKQPHPLPP